MVLTTAGSRAQARRLAKLALRERAAACVNLIPQVDSWYWWKGKVEKSREVLLVLKSSRRQFKNLCRLLKRAHPYEVPELLAMSTRWVEPRYGRWLHQNLRKP
ncbi:MAG: divalent-cation tolerance protein CutA [Candidatus Omnitrophica bacterium]|nr:divalent-cation tolerance protein CutA [Candidatus Omnitrophota bacterium]